MAKKQKKLEKLAKSQKKKAKKPKKPKKVIYRTNWGKKLIRSFKGKKYMSSEEVFSKSEADKQKSKYKKKGWNVRVITHRRNKKAYLYSVYTRDPTKN